MDRQALFQKLSGFTKKAKKVLFFFALLCVAGYAVMWAYKQKPIKSVFQKAFHIGDEVKHAVVGVQTKVEELRYADLENHRLKTENLNLRKSAEDLKFNCRMTQAKERSHDLARSLANDTGSRVGRVLASIEYRPPTHLLPEQVYALGVSYFKGKEHEKSAVIFSYLTNLEDDDKYKTPENYLMTGVSWYRLDHLKLADSYFDKVFEFPVQNKTVSFQAQARLWKGIVSKRLSQPKVSQKWLRDLMDYHPHSLEAAWVNGLEQVSKIKEEPKPAVVSHKAHSARVPASEQDHNSEAQPGHPADQENSHHEDEHRPNPDVNHYSSDPPVQVQPDQQTSKETGHEDNEHH